MNIQPKTLNLAGRVSVSEVGTEVGEVVESQEIEEVELSRHTPTVPGQPKLHFMTLAATACQLMHKRQAPVSEP